MTITGRIAFLPWVKLPEPVVVGGFRFVPTAVQELGKHVAPEVEADAVKALRTHVDLRGQPIESCTLIQRVRHAVRWDVPAKLLPQARRASELLALACLSEQRFMEEGHHFPHLNASMFRSVSMHVAQGDDHLSMTFRRRGSTLRMGGNRFSDTVFQQPPQIESTGCEVVNLQLAAAIEKARQDGDVIAEAIDASLEFFLLANAETPELDWESCVMLSAMAFDKLLRPSQSTARCIAATFAQLWARFPSIPLQSAKRIKPDNCPEWLPEQQSWPIHRKWMKEIYEARSARVHRGQLDEFSSNWAAWQHVVIAAFVYPLAIKLMLAATGHYALSDDEEVACEVLDQLLDSHWGSSWKRRPEWPSILSRAQSRRQMELVVKRALQETGTETN